MRKYVTNIAGEFPLVISVPHGGVLRPRSVKERQNGVVGLDRKTRFIARELRKELVRLGVVPYVVIMNVSRHKVDVNRSKKEGCESPEAERIWDEYHNQIQQYINECIKKFGKCFLIDLHGQNHNDVIEIGYCLKRDQLLDILEDKMLFKSTVYKGERLQSERELIFGSKSLSRFLKEHGYESTPGGRRVPSSHGRYFAGAYTSRHYDFENKVKGLQLEVNYSKIRNSFWGVRKFAKALARSLADYFQAIKY